MKSINDTVLVPADMWQAADDTFTFTTDADVTGTDMILRIVVWYERITAPCIATYNGNVISLLTPDPADVDIGDIAHSLSQINRYTGHTSRPYSVAAHSIIAAKHWGHIDPLAALLHDSAEAYIGDVASPLKRLLSAGYTRLASIEDRHLEAIGNALNIDSFVGRVRATKLIDKIMLVAEVRALLPYPDNPVWTPWVSGLSEEETLLVEEIVKEIQQYDKSPREVEEEFLSLYYELKENDNADA